MQQAARIAWLRFSPPGSQRLADTVTEDGKPTSNASSLKSLETPSSNVLH